MNRHLLTTCLLFPAILVYLCGAAQVFHESIDHHGVGVAIHTHDHDTHATHDHHDEQSDPCPLSQSGHDEDCSTCLVLSHIAASTLDLVLSSALPQIVLSVAPTPSRCVVACRLIHLPPGRGPPHAHL